MSCSLSLRGIGYINDNRTILNKIDLNLGHKEKIAIIGANGSGKSTLLKILAGLISPSYGCLELFHNKINSLKGFKNYRNDIGYLPQDVTNHFLSPTVLEDVMFSLRANGTSEEEAIKKTKKILDDLKILHLKDRTIFDLSGGEQKIVALAGLLIIEPKILLLDEPTNDLDSSSQRRVIELLSKVEKSMIIVSHQESFINNLVSSTYKLQEQSLIKMI